MARNILEEFFNKRTLAILKLFLFDEADKFYLREVAKKTKVPNATTFRIVRQLKAIGVVEETVIKKTKLYSLAHNKNTKLLSELFEEKRTILEEFVEAVSVLPGVMNIQVHGEESKDKTNIIVIGNGIDAKAIRDKVGEIKDKYNFNIIELVLDPAQFTQMIGMGLFPNKRSMLWEKSGAP